MKVAVGLGLMEFPFAGAGDYWRWVDLCEAGGVDSLWQTDRLVSRQPILECMTTMAALAGRTRRMRFGMNVVSLALRDPVLLAKQCATVDVLSEGRLLPAFGIGSPLGPEWQALDIDTKTRGRRTDDFLSRPVTALGQDFRAQGFDERGGRVLVEPGDRVHRFQRRDQRHAVLQGIDRAAVALAQPARGRGNQPSQYSTTRFRV